LLCTLFAIVLTSGCGYTGGELLFFTGLFRRKKIPAQFKLSDGPILILMDDPGGVVDWPVAIRLLQDDLTQELLKTKSAKKIIPVQTIQSLRQTHPDFDKRGCREVGRMADADQVLWVKVRDFHASPELDNISEAAYFVVSILVIDPNQTDKWKVRQWPVSPNGQLVSAKIPGDKVNRAKTRDAISKILTDQLATKIARYFHDYRPGDLEHDDFEQKE